MFHSQNKTGKAPLVTGLMGVVAGAAAGLLLAPKAGKATRQLVGEWLEQKRDQGGELVEKIKEQARPRSDRAFVGRRMLTGATMGILTGAAAALLLAPKSGRQTRRQVGGWLREKREAGAELLDRVK